MANSTQLALLGTRLSHLEERIQETNESVKNLETKFDQFVSELTPRIITLDRDITGIDENVLEELKERTSLDNRVSRAVGRAGTYCADFNTSLHNQTKCSLLLFALLGALCVLITLPDSCYRLKADCPQGWWEDTGIASKVGSIFGAIVLFGTACACIKTCCKRRRTADDFTNELQMSRVDSIPLISLEGAGESEADSS